MHNFYRQIARCLAVCLAFVFQQYLHNIGFSQSLDPVQTVPAKDTSRDKLNNESLEEWVFLENRKLKVGVKRTSGAAIGWLSLSGANNNLVNHFDRGRLIQQSYYGDADGSLWDKTKWRWNPVQGGHYLGHGAPVKELKVDATRIYSRSTPLHWATGELLEDCTMEQTIELHEEIVHVHFRFEYRGNRTHEAQDQEIPAIFLEPKYKRLCLYSGDRPWKNDGLDEKTEESIPGWPNEKRSMTEHWAAYVDDANFGLGAYVPVANELTCYRFGDGDREHGSCSYFAPLTRFQVVPGLDWEYDLYLTLGSPNEIRQRFQSIHQRQFMDFHQGKAK